MVLHSDNMSRRTKMGFQERFVNASGLATVQNLYIGDSVLPADVKEGAKGAHVKLLQLFVVPAVQGPYLTPVEKRSENHNIVYFQLCGEAHVVLVENSGA